MFVPEVIEGINDATSAQAYGPVTRFLYTHQNTALGKGILKGMEGFNRWMNESSLGRVLTDIAESPPEALDMGFLKGGINLIPETGNLMLRIAELKTGHSFGRLPTFQMSGAEKYGALGFDGMLIAETALAAPGLIPLVAERALSTAGRVVPTVAKTMTSTSAKTLWKSMSKWMGGGRGIKNSSDVFRSTAGQMISDTATLPKEKFALWYNYLSKRGVRFEIGTEKASQVLAKNKAAGLFERNLIDIDTNKFERIIYLPKNYKASAFYEEGLHALDSLKGRPSRMILNGENIDAYEYRAKSILMKAAPKRFSYDDFIELEQQLGLVKTNQYGMR